MNVVMYKCYNFALSGSNRNLSSFRGVLIGCQFLNMTNSSSNSPFKAAFFLISWSCSSSDMTQGK